MAPCISGSSNLMDRCVSNKRYATSTSYIQMCTRNGVPIIGLFSIFGASIIPHSDNGREFVASVIKKLCSMWDGLKIFHGKPRHSQSQGSVERANRGTGEKLTETERKRNSGNQLCIMEMQHQSVNQLEIFPKTIHPGTIRQLMNILLIH